MDKPRRRRWWEAGRSLDDERAWFAEDGLNFALDDDFLREHDVVVFRGELRLGDRRVSATVMYPPSYGSGGHPVVTAPDLPVGRHVTDDGRLCLDHPVLGEHQPMCGAEAVVRAERLWALWENDREALRAEEADAPDPKEAYYEYKPDSAVLLIDTDVGDGRSGYFRLQARALRPLRAALVEARVLKPGPRVVTPEPLPMALSGSVELNGAWRRVDSPPPFSLAEFVEWLNDHHRAFRDQQLVYAEEQRKRTRDPNIPAVFAFVYEDEGPARDETHDAWLFVAADPETSNGYFARAFHMHASDRYIRQPQLAPLQEKSIAVIGVGALGSPVADLLAKAGIGRVLLVDGDIIVPGNRVRHELDLSDVGRGKTTAMKRRLISTDPWVVVGDLPVRVGGTGEVAQELDDEILDALTKVDLAINLTVDPVAGSHLSMAAVDSNILLIHGKVSAGAWGARILIQRPRKTGCWDCLGLAQTMPNAYGEAVVVPEVADDPAVQDVIEGGCGDPTFTGPGFELVAAAAAVARVAVQVLLEDLGGYPPADFDLATLTFRDAETATPSAVYTRLPVHPRCPNCISPAA